MTRRTLFPFCIRFSAAIVESTPPLNSTAQSAFRDDFENMTIPSLVVAPENLVHAVIICYFSLTLGFATHLAIFAGFHARIFSRIVDFILKINGIHVGIACSFGRCRGATAKKATLVHEKLNPAKQGIENFTIHCISQLDKCTLQGLCTASHLFSTIGTLPPAKPPRRSNQRYRGISITVWMYLHILNTPASFFERPSFQLGFLHPL